MQVPFIYTNDNVLRMLDVLVAGSGEACRGEFFADRSKDGLGPCFGEDFLCALLATKERSEEEA